MGSSFLRNMKISHKIAFTHALLFLLLQILICSVLLYTIRIYYPIEASGQVRTLTDEISAKLVTYPKPLTNAAVKGIMPTIPKKYKAAVRLIDSKENVLAGFGEGNLQIGTAPPYDEILRKNSKEMHLVYCNRLVKTNSSGEVLLQVAIDISEHLEFNTTLFKVVVLLTALGFFISIFTGFIVSRVVLKPVSGIIKAAQSINADNLDMRLATSSARDELNELSITINSMVDRLQDSFEKQKQLVSDVSHELRTPISVVKGYASLLDRWGKDDKEVMQESISRISREAESMTRLVDDLLLLARKDSGTLKLENSSFDMRELIDAVIDETRTIKAACDIESIRNDEIQYLGDYRLIKQLLRILIDNSIKYSDNQCTIKITSVLEGGFVRVSVEDMGIGIPEAELGKIFDRFYRIDKARTRDKKGCGLGLPIAKSIVEAHNGKIQVESEQGKGTKVTVELPMK